jgi:hypothetical protein
MRPEKILVVHSEHKTRGNADPDIYRGLGGEVRVTRRAPRRQDAEWLVAGVDTVYSVECWYTNEVPYAARARGVKTVLQANPEMTGLGEVSDMMIAPTKWRLDALPMEARVLPFPTDFELLPTRAPRPGIKTLYHVSSTAMCDRNGTELLLDALPFVNYELTLKIRGGYTNPVTHHVGLVTVEWLGHHPGMFYEHWPEDVDALVLPRRYGGLCLPMQEAATLGLPIITLDLDPQREWFPSASLVPARIQEEVGMRGGRFQIHTCEPRRLGGAINALVQDPSFQRERSLAWARAISWEALQDHYDDVFRK